MPGSSYDGVAMVRGYALDKNPEIDAMQQYTKIVSI